MIGARTDFTITATVQTPLHIGTGAYAEVDGLGKDASSVRVALTHVDFEGYPIIPGSGVKGVLANEFDESPTLFGGKIDETDSEHLIGGKVIFWSWVMDRKSCQSFGPYNDKIIPGTNHMHADRSLFIETNTAIDPESGVVLAGRLFHQQMVAPGTCFQLSLSADADVDETKLAKLFALLCDDAGVSFGKGTKSSLGRLTVDVITLDARKLLPDGTLADTSRHWRQLISSIKPASQQSIGQLTLSCDGPFLIADPSVVREKGDISQPQITPRHTYIDQPLLTGTALLGALRAGFADWLAKTGRDGENDKDRVCKDTDDAANLSPSERIFGVTGWKGLLTINKITSTVASERQSITSVRLDRFSNAAIDNALFSTEVWVAPTFVATLKFDRKRSVKANLEYLEYLEDYLSTLGDPIWGGLRLGHGTNKGFGWFTAKFERNST